MVALVSHVMLYLFCMRTLSNTWKFLHDKTVLLISSDTYEVKVVLDPLHEIRNPLPILSRKWSLDSKGYVRSSDYRLSQLIGSSSKRTVYKNANNYDLRRSNIV